MAPVEVLDGPSGRQPHYPGNLRAAAERKGLPARILPLKSVLCDERGDFIAKRKNAGNFLVCEGPID